MAITYVGGQTAGRTNASSALSVNYALTGGLAAVPAADDFVIITAVTGSAAGNPAMAVTTPATWAALGQLNQSAVTADTSMNVSYKFMGSTPDTAVTIPGTTNNAWGEAYAIQVWRGVDPTTPLDGVSPVSAGGTGTGRPDPAAITPATAGAVVVICGGGAAGAGANYTAPTNYTTNFLTANGADTTDAMVGMGYRLDWTSGAENPAAFTGGTTGANDSWTAYTLALRPLLSDITAALTSVAADAAVGSVTPTQAITGVAADVAVGGVTPSHTLAATGTAADTTVGTLAPSYTLDATGTAAGVAVGGVTPSHTLDATGTAADAAVGTIITGTATALAGTAAGAAVGTTITGTTTAMAGVAAGAAVGTVVPATGTGVVRALTGVAAGAPVGVLTLSAAASVMGINATGSVGMVRVATPLREHRYYRCYVTTPNQHAWMSSTRN